MIYLSAIATVCVDTWATEIGNMINVKIYDVLSFSIVEQGMSGGVSLVGFGRTLLGSIIISLSASPWLDNNILLIIITLSDMLACIFDSILGSTIQCKFARKVCNLIIEKKEYCGLQANHSKGFKWLRNDGVNFTTGIFAGLISIAFSSLIL